VARKRQEAMERVREREREERQRAREVARQKEIAERCWLSAPLAPFAASESRVGEEQMHREMFSHRLATEETVS
jgi:hypothetical protein